MFLAEGENSGVLPTSERRRGGEAERWADGEGGLS